jgi:hypothetical protein
MTVIATLPTQPVSKLNTEIMRSKYTVKTYTGLYITENGDISEGMRIVLYMSGAPNATRVYANVWVWPKNGVSHLTGSGQASGWGYDKHHAAAFDAFRSAGIEITKDRSYHECEIKTAMEAIAIAAGQPLTRIMEF